jgi:hypothetical protein
MRSDDPTVVISASSSAGAGPVVTYGTRPNLNEASLNELVGVCGNTSSPWDWNGNGVMENGVSWNVNGDKDQNDVDIIGTLRDYDDWAHLNFGGLSDLDGRSAPVEVVEEQPPPTPVGAPG